MPGGSAQEAAGFHLDGYGPGERTDFRATASFQAGAKWPGPSALWLSPSLEAEQPGTDAVTPLYAPLSSRGAKRVPFAM